MDQGLSIDNRISWIETAKGILAFFVVFGHLLQNVGLGTYIGVQSLYEIIYGFHMPAFFILAGMVYKDCQELPIIKYISRQFKKLIFPCVFYAVAVVIYKVLRGMPIDLSTVSIAKTVLFIRGGIFQNLWFFPVLFSCNIIFRITGLHKKENSIKLIVGLFLCVTAFLFSKLWICLPLHFEVCSLAIAYMMLGMFLRDNSELLRRINCIQFYLLVLIVILLKAWYYPGVFNFYSLAASNHLFTICYSVVLSLFIIESAKYIDSKCCHLRKSMIVAGNMSGEIYGLHWPFVSLAELIFANFFLNSISMIILLILISILIIIILSVMKKIMNLSIYGKFHNNTKKNKS